MNNELALTDIIIELHAPSFEPVKKFYEDLGFEVVWENPPKDQKGYLVMRRNTSVLAFYCGNEEVYNHKYFKKYPKNTPRGYGVEIAIHITDQPIDKYYNKVINIIDNKCIVQPLEVKPWGTRDFRLVDPYGYYLSIRENDKILIP